MRFRLRLAAVTLILVLFGAIASAADRHNTPNYWKCFNRISGAWAFGQAPSACDGASFGADRLALQRYGPLVFHDSRPEASETARYMDELHAVLRDAAGHYLRRRKPRVSPVEVVIFRRALLALAHQESYWTHYRMGTDGRLKMMRGDLGHGHGLMQIDDRFHYVNIRSGGAWDLIGNITYALDLYYSEWENAVTAPCVKRSDDYEARARSAYSAYNGGAGQICRWTNRKDKWARNDQGFLAKFSGLEWSGLVRDPDRKAAFDVGCAMSGCSAPSEAKAFDPNLIPRNLVQVVSPNGIAIRRTPGGKKIGVVPSGAEAAVRSSLVRGAGNEIFLEIEPSGANPAGYIYVGRMDPEPTLKYWVKDAAR